MRREGRIFPESFSLFLLFVRRWVLSVGLLYFIVLIFLAFLVFLLVLLFLLFLLFSLFLLCCAISFFFPESSSLLPFCQALGVGLFNFLIVFVFLKISFLFPESLSSSFSVCFDTWALPCLIHSVQIATPRASTIRGKRPSQGQRKRLKSQRR